MKNQGMKRILGLDLGTNSIGWALVEEAENRQDSKIIKLGVRVNPLTTDEQTNFEKGRPITTNADRTLKRGARRNLQRYKLRRENLIEILKKHQFIKEDTPLAEVGKDTTHETLRIRAKAAKEEVSLSEFSRVLLAINKKRGYKSSRKMKSEDVGVAIDGMDVAKQLYENNYTPGQYVFELIKQSKKYVPDFYRSDLKNEFDKIWYYQSNFHPEVLDIELYKAVQGQGKQATSTKFRELKKVYTAENKGKREEKKYKAYQWRVDCLEKDMPIEQVAYVLVEINNEINKSSGYLGAIGDRSKILYLNNLTVGQYLYNQIKENPHTSLKNQVFYRKDYLDEFEKIWETQAQFHSVLTNELKEEIRDVVIFYQRKLKSQKGLLSFCQFESWEIERKDKNGIPIINKTTGKPKTQTVGQKVIPKSSPLFQEFKIWTVINNLELKPKKKSDEGTKVDTYKIEEEDRKLLFAELNVRGKLSENQVLKLLGLQSKLWKTNYKNGLEGNNTNKALFSVYQKIAEIEGYGHDWSKKTANEIIEELKAIFPEIGIDASILDFDAIVDGEAFDKQISYQLWHLLYSAEDDFHVSAEDRLLYGNNAVSLKKNLHKKFGFKPEYAKMLAAIPLTDDYGNLSARAIRKLIPHLQDGNQYDEACSLEGYNHSNSLNREEIDKRELVDRLDILPKNSLRNPVVEKILNQVINVVNQIIDTYQRPDEIRIELARELKKSADERADATKYINSATKANDEIRNIIRKEFGFEPTRNDLVRYKAWLELEKNGFKTFFTESGSEKKISKNQIFSKDVDIEHIIPKALLFDDSFSNKTLAFRKVNLAKGNRTAMDFIANDYSEKEKNQYIARVESMYKAGAITKGKYKKLLMTKENLPTDFIERDLRNSQYIAKKAKEILQTIVKEPIVSTSGSITDRLRKDWNLINVMKELNFPKYKALGLTEIERRWDSGREEYKEVEVIKDWTKRNDHRHHAMDALTVAFTTHNHIQYINNLNARRLQNHEKYRSILGIEKKITEIDKSDNRRFIAPMPNFRQEAKKHIGSILISFKAKNKVVTKNVNKTKKQGGYNKSTQYTPRGPLHKETIYGKIKQPKSKPTKLSSRFSPEDAALIVHPEHRQLVTERLKQYDNDAKKAFSAKAKKKDPLLWNDEPLNEVLCFEEIFTIRKDVGPDLNVSKVIDPKVKEVLQKRVKEIGTAKKAFVDLDKNPIWLNKAKGIAIKRVTISGISNAEVLHTKKNHLGQEILDDNDQPIPADYVSTGNNHHVAIYKDDKGNLQEQVVSFYEAVLRANQDLPIIDKSFNADIGWTFLFTMKQNEMFVFPSKEDDFDPSSIDILDENNAESISKHLFRVQKISTKNYMFNHHLNTEAVTGDDLKNKKMLSEINYHFIQTPQYLNRIIKVRTNHLGKIVQIGEY